MEQPAHIPRDLQCRFCRKTFSSKGNTTRHVRLYHPGSSDTVPDTATNGAANAAVSRSPLREIQQKSVYRNYSPMDCHSYCGSRGILFSPAVLRKCPVLLAQTSNVGEVLREATNRSNSAPIKVAVPPAPQVDDATLTDCGISAAPSDMAMVTPSVISPDQRICALAASRQDTSTVSALTCVADSVMSLPSSPGDNVIRQLPGASTEKVCSSPSDVNIDVPCQSRQLPVDAVTLSSDDDIHGHFVDQVKVVANSSPCQSHEEPSLELASCEVTSIEPGMPPTIATDTVMSLPSSPGDNVIRQLPGASTEKVCSSPSDVNIDVPCQSRQLPVDAVTLSSDDDIHGHFVDQVKVVANSSPCQSHEEPSLELASCEVTSIEPGMPPTIATDTVMSLPSSPGDNVIRQLPGASTEKVCSSPSDVNIDVPCQSRQLPVDAVTLSSDDDIHGHFVDQVKVVANSSPCQSHEEPILELASCEVPSIESGMPPTIDDPGKLISEAQIGNISQNAANPRKRKRTTLKLASSKRTKQRRVNAALNAVIKICAAAEHQRTPEGKRAAGLVAFLIMKRHVTKKDLLSYLKNHPLAEYKEDAVKSSLTTSDPVHSEANKIRSLQYLYSGNRTQSQGQYRGLIKANREGAKAGLDCLRPVPYRVLMKQISKLPAGTVQPFPEIAGEGRTPGGYVSLLIRLRQIAGNLIKLDKAQPGLISHRWDKEQGRFVIGYTLGGDACPAGEKQLTSFLVAPANVGRHISSSLHNHLLSLMECGEDTATAKWYVEQMCAEAEAIEGKCQFVDVIGNDGVAVGHAVEFRLFGFVGDQKFFATVAGEVNHAFEFPSPFVDFSKDTLKCTTRKVVQNCQIKDAFHPWTYADLLRNSELSVEFKKRNKPRKALLKDMIRRRTRSEFKPCVSQFVYDKMFPDPLHMSILGWSQWFKDVVEFVCTLSFDTGRAAFRYNKLDNKKLEQVMELYPNLPLVLLIKILRDIDYNMYRRIRRLFNNNVAISAMGFKGKDARTMSSHYAKICDLLLAMVTESDNADWPKAQCASVYAALNNKQEAEHAAIVAAREAGIAATNAKVAADAAKRAQAPRRKASAAQRQAAAAARKAATAAKQISAKAVKKVEAAKEKAIVAEDALTTQIAASSAKQHHRYQRYKVIRLFYIARALQKCCTLFCSSKMSQRKLKRLEVFAERYYAAAKISRLSPKPIHCHIGRVIPYYVRRVYKEYGVGLGLMDVNGREANHQLITYDLLHSGTGASSDPQMRWQKVFVHDYVKKIHLPELCQKIPRVNAKCLNYSPRPKGPIWHCSCGLNRLHDAKCRLCDCPEFAVIRKSAKKHASTKTYKAVSKEFKDMYAKQGKLKKHKGQSTSS